MAVHETRIALTVPDFEAAVRFWRDALGLAQVAAWDGPDGGGIVLDAGRATIELLSAAHAAHVDDIEVGTRVAGPVRLALHVDDSDAVTDRLLAAGGQPVGGPVVTPWGDRNTRLADPDGLQLTLFEIPK
jgi:methylmalonyl-CoA/ethylmalonyl-CoA epimerase